MVNYFGEQVNLRFCTKQCTDVERSESERELTDLAAQFLPFFNQDVSGERAQVFNPITRSGQASVEVLFYNSLSNPTLNAIPAVPSIYIDISPYVVMCEIPSVLQFVENLLKSGRFKLDDMLSMPIPQAVFQQLEDVVSLHARTRRQTGQKTRNISVALDFYRITIPFAFIIVARAISQFWYEHVMTAKKTLEIEQHASSCLSDWLCEFLLDEEANSCASQEISRHLTNEDLRRTWIKETMFDSWAYFACVDRFDPERFRPELSKVNYRKKELLLESVYPSERHALMYTYISIELYFIIQELVRILNSHEQEPKDAYYVPLGFVRHDIFSYMRSRDMGISHEEFLFSYYGAGTLVRLTIGRAIEEYWARAKRIWPSERRK